MISVGDCAVKTCLCKNNSKGSAHQNSCAGGEKQPLDVVCVCVFVSSFLCEDRNLHSTILVRTNSHVCVCICDCVSVYWRGIGWIIVFLNQQNPKISFISVLSDADHMIDIDPCCRPFMNKRSIIFKVKF